jgi:hypothetical protein
MESVSIIDLTQVAINAHLNTQNTAGYIVNFIYNTLDSTKIVAMNTPFPSFIINQYCEIIDLNEVDMNAFITTATAADYVCAFLNNPNDNTKIIGIATKQTYSV